MSWVRDPAHPVTTVARVRPRLHFTARQGWTNDPHGIIHHRGKYHMFFQHNPDGVTWSPRCHWGHAVSDDLLTWAEVEVALSPEEGEVGCWSGSVAIDERGPFIAYTRIAGNDWTRGQVVLARPRRGMSDWARDPAHPVIAGPPPGLDTIAFRDPHLRQEGGRWKATVGAGIIGAGGCALQYSSEDLERWAFDSVLARQPAEGWSAHTGSVWECPQLVQVGEAWVLVMSAWEEGRLTGVNYAIGDYDGAATFTPRSWGTFTHGNELYATSTFRDVDGRLCAISWLRERDNRAPKDSPWCSAMSLPHVLSIADGLLVPSQHPNLDALLSQWRSLGDAFPPEMIRVPVPGRAWRLRFAVEGYRSGGFNVSVANRGSSFTVTGDAGSVTVSEAGGATLLSMPAPAGDAIEADIVVDADILEITLTGAEGVGATRVPVLENGEMTIGAGQGSAIRRARVSAI